MSNVQMEIQADFCAVGDTLGALCAALAAARHGVKVALVGTLDACRLPDAPVGGIGEELSLSCRGKDTLHALAEREPNLTVLPAALTSATVDGARLTAVCAGGYTVCADTFADCTADGALLRLSDAHAPSRGGDVLALHGEDVSEQSLPDAEAFSDVIAVRGEAGIPFSALSAEGICNLYCADESDGACGQAIGTAAAIGVKYGASPAEVGRAHMTELQETLLYDDAFLPHVRRTVSEDALAAQLSCDDTVSGDILNLRTGIDRNSAIYGAGDQGFTAALGATVEYHMDEGALVTRARIVFDADGAALAKVYALEIEADGEWEGILFENENKRRLVTAAICRPITGIRLTVMETWGAENVHLFAFDFE